MSTMPPEQPTQQQPDHGRGPGGGPNINLSMPGVWPTPGNAELVVYILATILIGIIALAADRVDSPAFVTAFTAITFAYLISRGIAKASRVLER